MIKRLLPFICLLGLTACDPPRSAELGAARKISDGEVAKIAEAPDGTVLWAVQDRGETVYFASGGTQHRVSCGKACTRTIFTATAQ